MGSKELTRAWQQLAACSPRLIFHHFLLHVSCPSCLQHLVNRCVSSQHALLTHMQQMDKLLTEGEKKKGRHLLGIQPVLAPRLEAVSRFAGRSKKGDEK